jgi:hypothetical protein
VSDLRLLESEPQTSESSESRPSTASSSANTGREGGLKKYWSSCQNSSGVKGEIATVRI